MKTTHKTIRSTPLPHLFLTAAVLLATSANAQIENNTSGIVNGNNTTQYASTAALVRGNGQANAGNVGAWCSATLIGCKTVLTAAHCVEGLSSQDFMVYLQHGGMYRVRNIAMHPDYPATDADVAVLKLAKEVHSIEPSPLGDRLSPSSLVGRQGRLVGFGQTTGSANDYAIKRTGKVRIGTCPPGAGPGAICWDYNVPAGPRGQDSNTCNGDSGGPLFVNESGRQAVVGVTSYGTAGDCGVSAGELSVDASVEHYRNFILSQLGADTTSACGALPAVDSSGSEVASRSGRLSAGESDSFSFEVPGGAGELIFAMNGEDNGSFDADFFVSNSGTASSSNADCKKAQPNNFGVCSFPNAKAGSWSVTVSAKSGAGEYQLTATALAGSVRTTGGDGNTGNSDSGGSDTGGSDTGNNSTPSSGSEIGNRDPIHDLSVDQGKRLRYTFEVPAGATNLVVRTDRGEGDVDLYVRQGKRATRKNADCSATGPDNAERCNFATPAAGTWHILVFGEEAASGLRLKVRFNESKSVRRGAPAEAPDTGSSNAGPTGNINFRPVQQRAAVTSTAPDGLDSAASRDVARRFSTRNTNDLEPRYER